MSDKIYCPSCQKNIIPDNYSYLDHDVTFDENAVYHDLKVRCDHCSHDFTLYMHNMIKDVSTDETIYGEGMMLDRVEED